MRRESNRLSAPSYLVRALGDVPREYGGSSQSFLTEANSVMENGDGNARYFCSDHHYDGQRRKQHEDYRYYEHGNDHVQRMMHGPGRHPTGNRVVPYFLCVYVLHILSYIITLPENNLK